MCGIVGAVTQRDVAPLLLEGLKRLEYRGYDSAGIAIINPIDQVLQRIRTPGKVHELEEILNLSPLSGQTGIAHTRWATHGEPNEVNAHPHISKDSIAVVHNGIIENYDLLKEFLAESGYAFSSETDTEVAAHIIHHHCSQHENSLEAICAAIKTFRGTYALGIMIKNEPNRLIAVRSGSPLVIGLGIKEHFFASDPLALLPLTQQFIYLEEGDIADVRRDSLIIYDNKGSPINRKIHTLNVHKDAISKGHYRHYMQKEIFDQPQAIRDTLKDRLSEDKVLFDSFDTALSQINKIERVQIVACGTSYHAGMVGRYWLESLAGLPCQVEVASENRYRQGVVEPNSLFICISQSGETADTLASLRQAKRNGYALTLGICNVSQSSLVHECDLTLLTHAGLEIGVASTKAFTTQLVILFLLTLVLARNKLVPTLQEEQFIKDLRCLPTFIEQALSLDETIKRLAYKFIDKQHALFLGRGLHFPIAMEGALKLKEISYIHAEAYPAGELKHGPLALVDKEMPVVVIVPNNELLEKIKSNLHEVQARGGELIIFADPSANIIPSEYTHIFNIPSINKELTAILYTIPLQLLAYHVAVLKGTDVDQPRNLAKSVTVE
jgi:glutamine---fructose-6-phosphate transaminase (isomerizing)